MGSTNQTLAIFSPLYTFVGYEHSEINSSDVLFTESYGVRRKQVAMEISPGKSRCSIYFIMYTFVKQDSRKLVSSSGLR